MDSKKKNASAGAEKAGFPKPAGPIKVFMDGDVSASVFAREVEVRDGTRTFYGVSFSRSYRDSKGTRQYAKNFNVEDLGKVVTVAQQADDHIRSLQ